MTSLVVFVALVSTVGAQVPGCRDEQLKDLVARIENVRDANELAPLLNDPRQSVACLLPQLHVVKAQVLRPEDAIRRRRDFHVVWAIRALRYITGGKDFAARTKQFAELKRDRRHFLTVRAGKDEVSFFGVWMSRDVIYVAPEDAQKRIIEKWTRWYEAEGSTYSYGPAKGVDWYF